MNRLVWLRPVVFIAVLLLIWQIAVFRHPVHILPGPIEVLGGIADLVRHGLIVKYVVASLFRVTWGFVLAAVLAIPLGLAIGWRNLEFTDTVPRDAMQSVSEKLANRRRSCHSFEAFEPPIKIIWLPNRQVPLGGSLNTVVEPS